MSLHTLHLKEHIMFIFEGFIVLFVLAFAFCWAMGWSSSLSVIAIGTLMLILISAIRELALYFISKGETENGMETEEPVRAGA
jgi:uncharacterized membrane-anchored protein YitT (DUF2179 family)